MYTTSKNHILKGLLHEVSAKVYLTDKSPSYYWECTRTYGKLDMAGIDIVGRIAGKIKRLVQVKSSMIGANEFIAKGNGRPSYNGVPIEVLVVQEDRIVEVI